MDGCHYSVRLKREEAMIRGRFALACVLFGGFLAIIALAQADLGLSEPPAELGQVSQGNSYTGSVSCRKCHEKFYQLWAPSHHGLAMQPYTAELARKKLTPQKEEIVIGDSSTAQTSPATPGGSLNEVPKVRRSTASITPWAGRMSITFSLPWTGSASDSARSIRREQEEWFDMAASGVRHVPGHSDEPIHWKDWQYTFNTACYGCHVSQVSTNYDLKTDTYHTVWKEPGINCETCHGPAEEHIRVCEAAPKGTVPKDLKITRGGRDFTKEQNQRDMLELSRQGGRFDGHLQPGDKFFDHFGLVTLENPDYYRMVVTWGRTTRIPPGS
jgi:hypothetical protein